LLWWGETPAGFAGKTFKERLARTLAPPLLREFPPLAERVLGAPGDIPGCAPNYPFGYFNLDAPTIGMVQVF